MMTGLRKNVHRMTAALLLLTATFAFAQIDPCDIPPGNFRTQTQGGWGTDCHGSNPGCILEDNFGSVFPSGITIGGGFTADFSSAIAVNAFLPAGGTPDVLTADLVDPISTPAGVFAGQVLTLAINVAFSDASVPGFSAGLGNLVVNGGLFDGYTVYQILALANQVLGGNTGALPLGTTISNLNDAADAINNNFDDGNQSDGYLVDPNCDPFLPVEITAFDATPNGDAITLAWRTASETGIQSYELLRLGGGMEWHSIGIVSGAGDNPAGHSYRFDDRAVTSGTAYQYRLVVRGLDGSMFTYAGIASATAGSAAEVSEFALMQNYPNPFNPTTTIRFALADAAQTSLTVFDVNGRIVAELLNGNMPAGSYSVNFDARALAGGVYFYRLESGSFTSVRKLMLLK